MVQSEEDRKQGVTWLFCLVFPADAKKQEEADAAREAVLDELAGASLQTLLFYGSTSRQIFCKVGASDDRLLREADIIGYKLKLDEKNIKTISEADVDLQYGRAPIYIDYPYGPETDIPYDFKYKSLDGHWHEMAQRDVPTYIHTTTRMSPWKHLHVKYNDAWEQRILKDHGLQVYTTYEDGTILRPADRIKLMQKILSRKAMKDAEHGLAGAGLDVQRLIHKKKLLAAYPLQLGTSREASKEMTPDQLFEEWNKAGSLPWQQPLEQIRGYAGEKITLYFAFLGHYTKWLVLPAFIGTIIFIHQMIQLGQRSGGYDLIGPGSTAIINVTREVNGVNVTSYETELYTQVDEAPFFALFIALWASMLIEFWKRKQARYALEWGMTDFEQATGNRVQFRSSHIVPDPVTGEPVEYYSRTSFLSKLAVSASVIGFAIMVVVAAIAGILVLKVVMSSPEFDVGAIPPSLAPQLALVINAVAIIFLGTLYKSVARKLNDWENHRTNIQYEDMLIAKTFVFTFINSYATLAYFAFIKSGQDILGVTQVCIESATELLDEATDAEKLEIINADVCYGSLAYSLFIIFGTQIVVNNLQEVGLPFIMARVKALLDLRAHAKKMAKAARDAQVGLEKVGDEMGNALGVKKHVEKDLDEEKVDIDLEDASVRKRMKSPLEHQFYLKSYESPFDDYLELALQFGYVSLFVAAFPIAPLLALINNLIEVKVDSYKVCILSRRPDLPEAQDIGTWQRIFQIMGFAAVLSNAAVILFTSTAIDVADDTRVWLWVIFVGGVYALKFIIDFMIPDVPLDVQTQIERQKYIERKVFSLERDDEMLQDAEKKRLSQRMSVARDIEPCDPFVLELASRTAYLMKEADEGAAIDAIFDKADTNNSGTISLKELKKALLQTSLGQAMSKFELSILVASLDVDGDGTITRGEFKRFLNL